MSPNIIIGVLGAIIITGGGVWYYQTQIASDNAEKALSSGLTGNKTEQSGVLESIGNAITGSFSNIIGKGDSVQCTFAGIDPETKDPIDGVVYASGENFVMKADTVIDGKAVKLNIIQNGKVMYLWTDDKEVMPPFKLDVSAFEYDESLKPESPIDWLDEPESGVTYKCKNWSPKRDSFEPPKDIQFLDMFGGLFGGMMDGMMNINGDMGAWENN